MADPTPPTNPAAAGAAIGGASGTTAAGSGTAPRAPWDELSRALDGLRGQEQGTAAAVDAAKALYDAVALLPINDITFEQGTITSAAKATIVQNYVAATQTLAKLRSDESDAAARIASARQAYADAQDKAALTPETVRRLQADTDAARQQALVYGAQAELAQAQAAQLTSPAGQAAQAAKTRVDNAQAALLGAQQGQVGANTALTNAQTAETNAKAAAYPAESGAGITLTQAQAAAAQATAAATAQATREHQLGALGTFIDQITRTAAAGLITPQRAEAEIAAFAQAQETGATPYEWQQQADANARAISQSFIQSGSATAPGQQYVAGGEPGGILQQAAAQWGFTAPAVYLQPTSAPAYMQSLGMTVGTPPQVGGQGAPAPVQGGPAPVQGGPPAYAQSLPTLEDWSGHDLQHLHATLTAPAPSNGYVPNPMGRANAIPVPAGATMGGVNNGLALGPIITGAPNYARLPGT